MTKEQITDWAMTGREIEFRHNGIWYSITYFRKDGKRWISFCEFYKDTLDVENTDDLWESIYHGSRVSDLLSSVSDDEITVF